MLEIASNFYKNLFRKEEASGFSLSNNFFSPQDKVSPEENGQLSAPFSEEEVKAAVFGSYSDGALGPDGVPFFFYQKFWELIKKDLLTMFSDFYLGKLDIFHLNFARLTLIPKEPDASVMTKFRPISLSIVFLRYFFRRRVKIHYS